jgi:3-hydroxyisobutyrate dehydrogenase-like beta-hydroxyacid dehydrogenase
MKQTISVIGIGRMGAALAKSFLAAGHTTTVWNRSERKCEPLRALGARVAATVEQAAAASDLTVVVVSDYAAGDQLLRTQAVCTALRDKLLVELTSGSPMQARARAAWAGEQQIHYLDGAIMATPNLIGQPGCTILYAGPEAQFDRHRACWLALGDNARYVSSDVGHASVLDSALLIGMWGELFGVLQGAAICAAEGLAIESYQEHFEALIPVVSGGVSDLLTRIRTDKLAADTNTLAALDVHDGAFQHVRALCREHGLNRAIPDAFESLFAAARSPNGPSQDFAVLSKFMR